MNTKENVLKTKELPDNQDWLIERIASLGYKVDSRGICCGLGRMARQAFLAGDYESYTNRLVSLAIDPTPEAFASRMNILEQETEHLLQQVQVEKDAKKKWVLLKKIKSNRNILIDVHAFFTGVILRHKPDLYMNKNELFEGISVSQDDDSAAPWLNPVALVENPIVELKSFSAAYKNTNDIKKYLDSMAHYMGDDTFSLALDVQDHTIELSYSPQTKWLLTDANKLPGVLYEDTDKLSNAIHEGLFQSVRVSPISEAFFRTTFFCTHKNSVSIHQHIKELEKEPAWPSRYNQITYKHLSQLRRLMEQGISFDDLFNLSQDKFNAFMETPRILQKLKNAQIPLAELVGLELHKLKFLFNNDHLIPLGLTRIRFLLGENFDATNRLINSLSIPIDLFTLDLDKLTLILNYSEELKMIDSFYFNTSQKLIPAIITMDVVNLEILLKHSSNLLEFIALEVDIDKLVKLDRFQLEIVLTHSLNLWELIDGEVTLDTLVKLDRFQLEMFLTHSSNLLDLIDGEVTLDTLVKLDRFQLEMFLTHASNLLELIDDGVTLDKLVGLNLSQLENILANRDHFGITEVSKNIETQKGIKASIMGMKEEFLQRQEARKEALEEKTQDLNIGHRTK